MMLFSGLICVGFGMVLLMRSPLRAPLFERIFRALWLGAPGRWFLRSAAPQSSADSVTDRSKALVVTTAALSAPDARLAALEARLARLENDLTAK